MVLIHFKKSERNNFVLDFPAHTLVSDVLAAIIHFNNMRMYLDRLVWSIEELANKGVLKPQELQGISYEDYEKSPQEFADLPQQKLKYAKKPSSLAPFRYAADKHNQRQGLILPEEEKQILLAAVKNARAVLEPKLTVASQTDLVEAVETLRLAVLTVYPAYLDLPEWEPSLLLLEQKLPLQVLESDHFELLDKRAILWWAGKEMQKSKKICEYAGKNDKTKIIVKAQKIGGEQPLREPPVDQKTYQQMVKYYYKKVDESKQFDERIIETHYEKIEGPTMKEKLHLGSEEVKYKMF